MVNLTLLVLFCGNCCGVLDFERSSVGRSQVKGPRRTGKRVFVAVLCCDADSDARLGTGPIRLRVARIQRQVCGVQELCAHCYCKHLFQPEQSVASTFGGAG